MEPDQRRADHEEGDLLSSDAAQPWLALYPDGVPTEHPARHAHGLAMLDTAVAARPDDVAIVYFDGRLTFAELDRAGDALAGHLRDHGFEDGDRLALFAQNDPAFVIGLIAAWKAGGAAVPVNPMNRARELSHILTDSGATALLSLDRLHHEVAADVLTEPEVRVRTVVTYSSRDFQTRDDDRVLDLTAFGPVPGATTLSAVLEGSGDRRPLGVDLVPETVAVLTYTSGTTGRPKGAIGTHGNLMANATNLRAWMALDPGTGILAVAPLFHITGLVCHAVLALMAQGPLVLTHRFHPDVTLEAVREHRPAFTVGAITAFISLSGAASIEPRDFDSFTRLYSGGAAIAPAVAEEFEQRFGAYIHNAYGLTESASVTHLVPHGLRAPVDPTSGALSIGVPVTGTTARIVGEGGEELPPGEIGELLICGPQVAPGYWRQPEASSAAMPDGELRTGDVAFMDQDGWFYIVDRKKDMINASGYKVWPREVEDVLYTHPAVREAAVVGVPDPYRGETVRAFVSLRQPGTSPAELVEFCKAQMAAYKYPREVVVVDDLPKTASGKILRRELRSEV